MVASGPSRVNRCAIILLIVRLLLVALALFESVRMIPPGRRAQHVIIVSEDGLRPDALLASHAHFHSELLRRAAYSFAAQTIRHASTLPSHAARLPGVDDKRHGLSWNSWKPDRGFIRVGTVFSEVEQHGMKAAAFVGKRKLEHILPPGSIDKFERPGYLCKKVVEEAARYF